MPVSSALRFQPTTLSLTWVGSNNWIKMLLDFYARQLHTKQLMSSALSYCLDISRIPSPNALWDSPTGSRHKKKHFCNQVAIFRFTASFITQWNNTVHFGVFFPFYLSPTRLHVFFFFFFQTWVYFSNLLNKMRCVKSVNYKNEQRIFRAVDYRSYIVPEFVVIRY